MDWMERIESATAAIEASGPGEWDRIGRLVAERDLLCAQAHACGAADLDRLRAVWERGQLVEQRIREAAEALRAEAGECNRLSAHVRCVSNYR
jgi:hypothetical protein